MGWLSAIGQGGEQAMDRYSQWRQLDQENQWKEKERQRQLQHDARAEQTEALQRRALEDSITKGELAAFRERNPLGTKLTPQGVAQLQKLNAAHLIDQDGVYTGTQEDRDAAAQRKFEVDTRTFTAQERAAKVAEQARRDRGLKLFEDFRTKNPKATAQQAIQALAAAGVDELPQTLQANLAYEQALQVAEVTASRYAAQQAATDARQSARDTAEAERQRQDDIRGRVAGTPKSFAELVRLQSAKQLAEGEEIGPKQKGSWALQWGDMRKQLSDAEREAKMPLSNQPYLQGSKYYQKELDSIDMVASNIAQGSQTAEAAMQAINSDPRLQDQEKWALRETLREYLGPLMIPAPTFSGQEPKGRNPAIGNQAPPSGRPVAPRQMMPQVQYGGGLPTRSSGLTTSHTPLMQAIRPRGSRQ